MARTTPAILIVLLLATSASRGGESFIRTINHDGQNRSYRLYIPDGYNANEPWPLVLNMHGATGNASGQVDIARMNPVADEHGFLVAYPDAVGGLWNDVISPARQDDFGFLESLLGDVGATHSIESSRVYASGFSQGGAMSYYLSHFMPDRFAAIASVAGPPAYKSDTGNLPIDWRSASTTSRPFPIMHIHGTADPVVRPDRESTPLVPGNPVLPKLSDLLGAWITNNQCDAAPTTFDFADTVTTDGSSVRSHTYGGCATYRSSTGDEIEAEVVHLEVVGGEAILGLAVVRFRLAPRTEISAQVRKYGASSVGIRCPPRCIATISLKLHS